MVRAIMELVVQLDWGFDAGSSSIVPVPFFDCHLRPQRRDDQSRPPLPVAASRTVTTTTVELIYLTEEGADKHNANVHATSSRPDERVAVSWSLDSTTPSDDDGPRRHRQTAPARPPAMRPKGQIKLAASTSHCLLAGK
ncbi:hypothetical protein CGCF415_v000032 [Colletotrichum fructicola]|nr:hypothetical protein CGCFRS4_v000439 [Colletotrichum fructicola]KAF4917344.1 hypothetical protein CGCF415_v000032 [Colletotrichum fructicola]KAF4935199.1 hypothetical protein CGCF245_v007881 [Colletotrichum fructicola]